VNCSYAQSLRETALSRLSKAVIDGRLGTLSQQKTPGLKIPPEWVQLVDRNEKHKPF
jgi:hypothetical protein